MTPKLRKMTARGLRLSAPIIVIGANRIAGTAQRSIAMNMIRAIILATTGCRISIFIWAEQGFNDGA